MRGPRSRRGILRGVVVLPSTFTIANLFFGFWAIVAVLRHELALAAWLVVLAGIADTLDGRVARSTRTGSAFGAELDSLIDLVSFGVAPALIIYTEFLAGGGEWSWVVCFLYVMAAALRLARFNVEQGGTAKVHFRGLPSPPAGITLAVFYPFSQTDFFAAQLAGWPWKNLIVVLTLTISALMVSPVLYPVFPRITFRGRRARVGSGLLLGAMAVIAWRPSLLLFPAGLGYVFYGVGKAALLGLAERLPEREFAADELEPTEAEAEDPGAERGKIVPLRFRRRRRRGGTIP